MNYQVTGNEYLSPAHHPGNRRRGGGRYLPVHAAQGPFGVLRGDAGPIRPYVQAEGTRLPLHPVWRRAHCWIPSFTSEESGLRFSCTYLTPIGERALFLRLSVTNTGPQVRAVRFGTEGEWGANPP